MTNEELFKKNQHLSMEFELYIVDHPEIEAKIPDGALIVLMPDYDQELAEKNRALAEASREKGKPVVFVRVKTMRASRIEGLSLQVA